MLIDSPAFSVDRGRSLDARTPRSLWRSGALLPNLDDEAEGCEEVRILVPDPVDSNKLLIKFKHVALTAQLLVQRIVAVDLSFFTLSESYSVDAVSFKHRMDYLDRSFRVEVDRLCTVLTLASGVKEWRRLVCRCGALHG